MFEVATLSGNKVDSTCALRAKTKTIMGQIIGTTTSNKGSSTGGSKLGGSGRQSSFRKSKRESTRINESIIRVKNETNRAKDQIFTNGQIKPIPDRPVTINAFDLLDKDGINARNSSIESTSSASTKKPFSSKEFYTSGEGYHKTDVCYYKTVTGTYQKLPHDSYHKMTENCYVKLNDGSYRRFSDINNSIGATAEDQVQLRVKSHVKRFLNRSKSHTPATIKEMQRQQKENSEGPTLGILNETTTAASTTQQQQQQQQPAPQNRRVMVTMIEGGMPVVATSKASKSSGAKSKNRTTSKVNIDIPKIHFF